MGFRSLVGRGAELETFGATLTALASGRPAVVLLTGEPGIGKSRLLAELGARADAGRMLVLAAGASEFEHDLPFWLFVDALDEYLRAAGPDRLAGLDHDAAADLAEVLPSWPAPVGAEPRRGDPRYRAHRAVRRLLEVLAAAGPLALLLDDLHWADSGSAELICALLRRPPAGPVLIGLATRPRQTGGRLAAALDRARTDGLVTRLELGPLSLPDARALLGAAFHPEDAAALWTESGGNPFYLGQLARTRRDPAPPTTRPAGDAMPPAVTTAISAELAGLDRDTRRVLEAAAVAGDPFLLELVGPAAGLPEAAVVDALDRLQARDLVRPAETPRRFRFRHPLVRRAVYDAAPRAWRSGAHERIAAALAARGVAPAGRAQHVVQSARRGDPAAVALLREAGEAVVRRAPDEAVRWFRAALDLLQDAPPADTAPLWTALGGALGAAGHLAEARAALVRAMEALPADVPLIADCARIEHTLGFYDAAHRRLMGALDRIGATDPAVSIRLMTAIAQDHLFRLEHDRAVGWSRRAGAAAERLGDRHLRAEAAAGLALGAALTGVRGDAEPACTAAAELIDALTDDEIGHAPIPMAARLAAGELFIGRLRAAGAHVERALLGAPHHVPVLFWAGTVRITVLALAAARTAETIGAVLEAAVARQLAARALAASGDTGPAIQQLQQACAVFDRCGAPRRRAEAERQLRRLGHRRVHHRTARGDGSGAGLAALTERERQIARLVTDRRTNACGKVWGHNGGVIGFTTDAYYHPGNGRQVSVALNANNAPLAEAGEIHRTFLVTALCGPG